MIDSRLPAFVANHLMDGVCEVSGICRSADLIADNIDFVALIGKTKHSLHEVVAEFGIEPCRSDDHGVVAERSEEPLSFELGATVDALGIRLVIFFIRAEVFSGENIVGGDVYHLHAMLCGSLPEIADGTGVYCRCL